MSSSINPVLLEKLQAEAEKRQITPDALLATWLNRTGYMHEVYDVLTDTTSDLIAGLDAQLRYTYVNPASIRMLGKPADEILGRTLQEMQLPYNIGDYLAEQIRIPFSTGQEHCCQYQIKGRKNTYTFDMQMIPVYNADGSVGSVLTVSRDITRSIMTEAALKDSERRYRSMIEGQTDLVCTYTLDTRITYVNDSYCAYFGKRREDIIGTSFLQLTDAQERHRIQKRIEEIQRNPAPRVEEYRITRGDGSVHWISWVDHGITDDSGAVVMVQAIGRDITHTKQIEQQLELEHARYEQLFNETPLPLFVYDTETLQYMAVNDAALQVYGYSRAEFLSMTLLALRPDDHQGKITDFLDQRRRSGSTSMNLGIWTHRRKDGTLFEVEITGRDLIYNGRSASMVMATDITARRALEAERMYAQSLEIELQKEREITMLKERFTSMVTHEFRTPVSIIMSTVDILKNYLHRLSKENIAEKLDIVTGEANRITLLLDDVLKLSRASAGRLHVSPERLDIVALVQEIIENLRLASRDSHRFEITASVTDPSLYTDRRLVEQILINLLSNAIKYSPAESSITTHLEPDPDGIIIRISDQGVGIPPADQPRIFEAFHRADNAAAIEGTGLGLTIVRESLNVLGGDIQFESAVGKGTTFSIHLPARALSA